MRWNYIILRFLKCAEIFPLDVLSLFWNIANALKFYCFHVLSKMLKLFDRICWICAETLWKIRRKKRWFFFFKTFTQNALKLYYFTFSQECWYFSTDVLNLCWNFARNALKFYCFYVFSKALKFFYGCAEFVLKLCKKCAQIFLFSRFLKIAETFLLICWIYAETL